MKNKRETTLINRILKILNTPEKWTKTAPARDISKTAVYFGSDEAICWCLDGALSKALWEQKLTSRKWTNSFKKITKALNTVLGIIPTDLHRKEGYYITFNDYPETTYEDVISTLKKAKERLNE